MNTGLLSEKKNIPPLFFPLIGSVMLHIICVSALLLFAPPIHKIKSDFQGIFAVGLYPAVSFEDRIKSFSETDRKNTDNAGVKDTTQPEKNKQKMDTGTGKSAQGQDITLDRKETEQINEEVKSNRSEESRPLQDISSASVTEKPEMPPEMPAEKEHESLPAIPVSVEAKAQPEKQPEIEPMEVVSEQSLIISSVGPSEQNIKDSVAHKDTEGTLLSSDKIEGRNDLDDQRLIAERTPEPLLYDSDTEEDIEDEPSADSAKESGIIFTEPEAYADLKIGIKAEESLPKGLKIIAVYKEFLKNRRNEPLTRSEVNRVKKIAPKIINRGDNALTAMVETTDEGIYDFIIELVEFNGKPVKADFDLKLYEKSEREKSKTLGTMPVEDKTLIMKILMPEGILWDDTSYFDGYIEDYESITKYKTQSELVWREYK